MLHSVARAAFTDADESCIRLNQDNIGALIEQRLAIIGPAGQNRTAKQRFDEASAIDECDPIERLRFFCSLAMNAQDWIDVEPLFDEVRAMLAAAPAEPQL